MVYLTVLKKIFIKEKVLHSLLFAVIPALLFYVVSLAVLRSVGFNEIEILRDPAQQNEQSSFLGFLSNIGIWLWVSSAAICFFSAMTGNFSTENRQRELLFLTGILSATLAVDDFFLIHDRYVSENLCFLAYAVFAGALLRRHYQLIEEVEGFAFLLAGLLLALSILTDLTQNRIPLPYYIIQVYEEGFKFIGGAVWLYFCFRLAAFHPLSSGADN